LRDEISFFSWKNEFRQWIGDLEPCIPIYLFSADDVAKKDRIHFLRRVNEFIYNLIVDFCFDLVA
jgi:hypothetical protein